MFYSLLDININIKRERGGGEILHSDITISVEMKL